MPWKESGPVLERTRFIEDYLSGFFTITELAARYGVTRRTLHKWLARHDEEGSKGLIDPLRKPLHSPQQTNQDVAAKIVAFRKRFPFIGPRKIITRLTELHPRVDWPAASTAGDILRRAELVNCDVPGRCSLKRVVHPGDFRQSESSSRQEGPDERAQECAKLPVGAVEWFAMQKVKVERVMTDNGSAFLAGQFSKTCKALDVRHKRTKPYTPRTNGKAERFIQTLLLEWAYRFSYDTSEERKRWLTPYLHFYNYHRAHSAVAYNAPISRLDRNNVLRRNS